MSAQPRFTVGQPVLCDIYDGVWRITNIRKHIDDFDGCIFHRYTIINGDVDTIQSQPCSPESRSNPGVTMIDAVSQLWAVTQAQQEEERQAKPNDAVLAACHLFKAEAWRQVVNTTSFVEASQPKEK